MLLAAFIGLSIAGLFLRDQSASTHQSTDSVGSSPSNEGESEENYQARMRFQEYSRSEDLPPAHVDPLDDDDR
jgi:hypothetical protein